uniref:Arrestin_N domain-containing protein n=1 Tax=Syphacia muris TaxID=451379 RepID=A0A0N5ACA8_9BILA
MITDNDLTELLDTIEVNIFGTTKVIFTIPPKHNKNQLEHYQKSKIIIDKTIIAYKKELLTDLDEQIQYSDNPKAINEKFIDEFGQSSYSFHLQLPTEGIYQALQSPKYPISISYTITVPLLNDIAVSLYDMHRALIEQYLKPVQVAAVDQSKKKLVDLQVPQRYYQPMTKLNAKVTIQNGPQSAIRYSHLNLVQKIYCQGCSLKTGLERTVVKYIEYKGDGLPKNVPTTTLSFHIEQLANVQYFIKLNYEKNRKNIYGYILPKLSLGQGKRIDP